jgi:FMN-dependent dehydrogenase
VSSVVEAPAQARKNLDRLRRPIIHRGDCAAFRTLRVPHAVYGLWHTGRKPKPLCGQTGQRSMRGGWSRESSSASKRGARKLNCWLAATPRHSVSRAIGRQRARRVRGPYRDGQRGGERWHCLYPQREFDHPARRSGPVQSERAGFGFPIRLGLKLSWDVATHPRWLAFVLACIFVKRKNPHIDNLEPWRGPGLFSRQVAGIAPHEALCWSHIRLIRGLWQAPLVVKGILSPADAALARDCGVDGIILADHGGRQLNHAVSPMQTLTRVLEQAGDVTVMIDSGFRRGTDIIKALALGARAVFVGPRSFSPPRTQANPACPMPSRYWLGRSIGTWQCWAPVIPETSVERCCAARKRRGRQRCRQ